METWAKGYKRANQSKAYHIAYIQESSYIRWLTKTKSLSKSVICLPRKRKKEHFITKGVQLGNSHEREFLAWPPLVQCNQFSETKGSVYLFIITTIQNI